MQNIFSDIPGEQGLTKPYIVIVRPAHPDLRLVLNILVQVVWGNCVECIDLPNKDFKINAAIFQMQFLMVGPFADIVPAKTKDKVVIVTEW